MLNAALTRPAYCTTTRALVSACLLRLTKPDHSRFRVNPYAPVPTHTFVCTACRTKLGLTDAFEKDYDTKANPPPPPPAPEPTHADQQGERDSGSVCSDVPGPVALHIPGDTVLVSKGATAFTRLRRVQRADAEHYELEFYASEHDSETACAPVAVLACDVRTQCQQALTGQRYQYVLRAADAEYAEKWRAQEEQRLKDGCTFDS